MSYIFQTKTKINRLKRQFEVLAELNTRVEEEMVARSLDGDDGEALKMWNSSLKEVKRKAQQLLERENASSYSCSCFFTSCPNPEVRWRLGREAVHITKDIVELLREKENHGNIRSHYQVLEFPGTRNEYNPPSRSEKCDEIFNLLKNSDEQFVGCYGMGGLGKTTLAKEVWRLARGERQTMNNADASGIKDEKVFDKVIMIQVSTSPVIKKIQEQIAEVLGISLNVNGEMERAVKLDYALKKTEDKVLIIFDDIWDVLDMRSVGVPCENGVLNPKILLTSRTLSVLTGTGSGVNIQLDELSESESKNLFESIVGKVENERLAEKILEKCGGHPLTISVVAGIVKHKNLNVWEATVTQLSRIDNPDFEKKIYSVFDLSINNVDEERKNLMLLCGILGENMIPVWSLLMYCMGLHPFKSMDTLDTAWVRLHKLLHDLIDRSLLIGFDETLEFVKIHDMARYSAARLAMVTNKVFTPGSDNKLDRLPSIPNNVSTIFLPCAVDEFPDTLKFPDLEFFLYHPKMQDKEGEDVGSDAPRCFTSLFAECEKLMVLSLKGISMGLSSLVNLKNLRTLCLHGCSLKDSGFSDIKELKNLRVLSLQESNLTCLPEEVKMLTWLMLLDLSGCKDLDFIPAGVLSKLSKLEHLFMRNTVKFRWNREGSASLSELELMKRLRCIDIGIQRGMELPEYMDCNKLQKFYINQGIEYHDIVEDNYECKILLESLPQGKSGTLLQRADFIHLQRAVCQQKVLFGNEGFENLSKLHIDCCEGMQHLFSLSLAINLVKLRSLIIQNSDTIEEIVYIDEDPNRNNTNRTVNFPNLVELILSNLSRLRCFVNTSNVSSDCQLPLFGKEVSLRKLSNLSLNKLPKLEILWSENILADSFSKLYCISIDDCSALVTLFNSHASHPKLFYLSLMKLPKMAHVWSENMQSDSFSNLHSIFIRDCCSLATLLNSDVSLPKLYDLRLIELPKLETVWSENMPVDSLSQLNTFFIQDCSSIITLFNSNVSLPELYLLKIIELPKLETIWSENMPADSLGQLNTFFIQDCSSLVTLFNSNVYLPGLQSLMILNLPQLETMCAKQLLDGSLSNLRKLEIEDCYSVRTPFTFINFESHLVSCRLKNLPNLDGLWVENLINLSQRTLTYGSVVGCGTMPHHILDILKQFNSIITGT